MIVRARNFTWTSRMLCTCGRSACETGIVCVNVWLCVAVCECSLLARSGRARCRRRRRRRPPLARLVCGSRQDVEIVSVRSVRIVRACVCLREKHSYLRMHALPRDWVAAGCWRLWWRWWPCCSESNRTTQRDDDNFVALRRRERRRRHTICPFQ